jgi:hypothetical protein
MDEPNKSCDCYTLQSIDTTGTVKVIRHDPVVTLGLISALLLMVTGLVCAIFMRRRTTTRRRHSWW